jgi:hypothetical protein
MNYEELAIMNRISLLSSRGAENANIIKKLKRRLRRIQNIK